MYVHSRNEFKFQRKKREGISVLFIVVRNGQGRVYNV